MSKPLCIIVGFGAGVGLGIARAFGQVGFQLGLISRHPAKYADLLQDLAAAGIDAAIAAADVSDEPSLTAAIASLTQTHGTPEVLVYNVVSGSYGQPTTLNAETMIQDFKANVVGGLIATKAVLPEMQTQSKGCILFTGGGWAHYPWDGAASMSIGKAGIRSLALTLAQELQETPIRIGLVSIMGQVAPGTAFDPEKIGAAFLAQYQQPVAGYETEFMFQG
jgi:short-subunit dehydrogenase